MNSHVVVRQLCGIIPSTPRRECAHGNCAAQNRSTDPGVRDGGAWRLLFPVVALTVGTSGAQWQVLCANRFQARPPSLVGLQGIVPSSLVGLQGIAPPRSAMAVRLRANNSTRCTPGHRSILCTVIEMIQRALCCVNLCVVHIE